MRAKSWDDVPLLLTVNDLRDLLGVSREQAYQLAHLFGRRVGSKFLVGKSAVRDWFEEAEHGQGA